MDKNKLIESLQIEILKAHGDLWLRGRYIAGLKRALEIVEEAKE